MKSKYFFVYGILVLAFIWVILVSGCTSNRIDYPPDLANDTISISAPINTKSLQNCQTLDHELARKACHRSLALKTHNSAYCIKDDYACFSSLARLIKDETLCGISSAEKLKELGKRDQDIEILSTLKDECLLNVAIIANNIQICEKISNEDVVKQCTQLLNQVLDCDATQEISKQNCYAHQAQVQLNSALCDKINTPRIQEVCKDQVYLAASVYYNDMEKCNLIQNSDQKDSCIIELSVINNDEEICLETSEKNQNSCFQLFASKMLNPKVCSRINPNGDVTKLQAEDIKDSCFVSLARMREEKDLCNKITKPNTRDYCFKLLKELGIE